MTLDGEVKDAWGLPVLRFHYRFGDNEIKMAEDWPTPRRDHLKEQMRAGDV